MTWRTPHVAHREGRPAVYVSLKDVAARAGVSFQTASKVLNGRRGVAAPATVDRIHAAATELGYVPNGLARQLVGGSTVTVGILADDLADVALSGFVAGAQEEFAGQGQAAVLVGVRPEIPTTTSLRTLLERRVDGVLVVAPSLEADGTLADAFPATLPLVSLNHLPGVGAVLLGSDHRRTGALAAEHLLDLGHRAIGAVTGPAEREVVQARDRGFRDRLDEAGVPLPDVRVATADWTPAGAYAAAGALLDAAPDTTALFVHNDVMAAGVLRLLADRGLEVPAQVSVIGCDDLEASAYLVPALTTVHVPFAETGARAATLLLDRIAGREVPRRLLLPVHLVVRASTGPSPGRPPPP
ncbi:LacI family DNA-binding transcriptional regulator [Jatrophihabitans sp. YIM 134969]